MTDDNTEIDSGIKTTSGSGTKVSESGKDGAEAAEFKLFRLNKDVPEAQGRVSDELKKAQQLSALISKESKPFPMETDPFIDRNGSASMRSLKISSPFNRDNWSSKKRQVVDDSSIVSEKPTKLSQPAFLQPSTKINNSTVPLPDHSLPKPNTIESKPSSKVSSSGASSLPLHKSKELVVKTARQRERVLISSDDSDIPVEILEEMNKIHETFEEIDEKYRLIDKIGEGTFSSVYKAEDISGTARYLMGDSIWSSPDMKRQTRLKKKKKVYVALKRIYVTSSPQRISNELTLLYMLSGSSRVAPLLEALRYQDQIIAVLPYYPHSDFREFFRDLPIEGIKVYMYELFSALDFVHRKFVIHRDIKPTNFLYDPYKKRGVLVDFGLAEQERIKPINTAHLPNFCPCSSSVPFKIEEPMKGYPKNDDRQARRANRAGTRGFRAPEVLLKCPYQTTKIDIWSAGVILLTLLSRRFPFFNSRDDTDALVELTTIFGLKEMKECAAIHGLGIETTLTTLDRKIPLSELIHNALSLEKQRSTLPSDSVAIDTLRAFNSSHEITYSSNDTFERRELKKNHKDAFEVMEHCFELDVKRRSTASDILKLPFFESLVTSEDGDIVRVENINSNSS